MTDPHSERLPSEERAELVRRLASAHRSNVEAEATLRGRKALLNPVKLIEERLDLFVTLAFGPMPDGESAQASAEAAPDARLIFECEWQERLRLILAGALRESAGTPEIIVPKGNGLHLPGR